MFSDAKAGDSVWSVLDGWGVITSVRGDCTYGVRVYFGDATKAVNKYRVKEFSQSYTKCGKLHYEDLNPILFWDEIVFEVPKKPLPDLEVDTKVLVWDVDKPKNKLVRYFCSFDASGRVVVFQHGTTSFSCEGYTEIWSEWEVYKEHESE